MMRFLFFAFFIFAATLAAAQSQQPLYTLEQAPADNYIITTDTDGYQLYKTVSDFYSEDLKATLDSFYLLISDSTTSYVTVKQLSDSLATITGDGNGIFDATNDGGTITVNDADLGAGGFRINGTGGNVYNFQQNSRTFTTEAAGATTATISQDADEFTITAEDGTDNATFTANATVGAASLTTTSGWAFELQGATMPAGTPTAEGLPAGEYIGYTIDQTGAKAGQSNTGFFPVDSIATPADVPPETFFETFEGVTGTTLTVTENGGVLPAADADVLLMTATGPVFQGAGAGEYTISRAGTPNTISLNTTPPGATNFVLIFKVKP
jgi:hypothetical protein